MVQLTQDLVKQLDEEAAKRGVSRSALVRDAVARYLAETGQASIVRRIIEGYTKLPPATPDEWGRLEELTDRSAREVLQRLDAEERAAGNEPW